jgi:hypothetical protein
MNADTVVAGIFLDPPVDTVARYPDAPLIISIALALPVAVLGILYTMRTRSPLFVWSAVTGVTGCAFIAEPVGDWPIAVWYPHNNFVAATAFGRPMPWFEVLFYLAIVPLGVVVTWEMIKRGTPAKRLLQFIAVFIVLEVPLEVVANHFDWMIYYGNHALVGGVPIYCYVQNGGMLAPLALILALLIPRMHGWRWILFPPALTVWWMCYAVVVTFPAYIAIAVGAGPAIGWLAAILATVMNAVGVVACVYSPPLRRLREAAQRDRPGLHPLPVDVS